MFQLLLGFFQSLLRRIKPILTSLKCCLIFDKLILTVLETLLVLTKLVLTIRKCLLIFAQLLFNDLMTRYTEKWINSDLPFAFSTSCLLDSRLS